MVRWWGISVPHGVVGLDSCLPFFLQFLLELGTLGNRLVQVRGVVVGSRVTGMDRQRLRTRQG